MHFDVLMTPNERLRRAILASVASSTMLGLIDYSFCLQRVSENVDGAVVGMRKRIFITNILNMQ